MKKKVLLSLLFTLSVIANNLSAQEIYNTTNGEIIFSWSDAKYTTPDPGDNFGLPNNNTQGSIADALRFTIWFHLQTNWHYDFSNKFGIYTGIGNRNIGFITKEMSTSIDNNTGSQYMVKWKRRAYALGVPLAFKVGNMDKNFYLFAGGQIEWLYHYKEKEFLTTGKRKSSEWWSERVTTFLPSVFIGFSFPQGTNIKFTFAIDNFMNKSYTDAAGIQPYKYMDSRIMYLSIYQSVRWTKVTYEKKEKKEPKIAFL